MLNLKLKTVAELINKDDVVIDVATDHAYLAIYLKKNKLCKEVYASDISRDALANAYKNIKSSQVDIKLYQADGLINIPIKENNINTVIIAGIGTKTALDIVKNSPYIIPKYIISSNNNHDILRKEMQNLGYYNTKELVIKENNKYYPIIEFHKSQKKDSLITLKYGKSSNLDYYQYLLAKEEAIEKKIPDQDQKSIIKHQEKIKDLKNIIKGKNADY